MTWATSGCVLGSEQQFKNKFGSPITAARDIEATTHDLALGKKAGDELQAILKPYLLRRSKEETLAHLLPPKQEFVVWTHLSTLQRQKYLNFVRNDANIRGIMRGEKHSALASLSWLKKLCGFPMLVDQNDDEAGRGDLKSNLGTHGVENVVEQSAKLGVLLHMVPALIDKGHRILIFSQSTKMLDIIQFVLQSKLGERIARIDGTTAERNRQRYVDMFNEEQSQFDVMLLSTRAGKSMANAFE
jgi:SNF2 family DNA or RNA helicase